MNKDKIKAILEWQTSTSFNDIQVFLGFANFYRRFIKNYSKVVAPMTMLRKKDTKFNWIPAADSIFNALKKAIITTPILRRFDPEQA